MDKSAIHVISLSGGKDSTALFIKAKQVAEAEGLELLPIFADTGHEHPMTYEYVDYLEKTLGPIKRVMADFAERIAKKRKYIEEQWPVKFAKEGVPEAEIAATVERALSVLHPTGNAFLDLCLWKGRFPSTKARFCTQELKIFPIMEQVYMPLLESGRHIVSWQGIRRQESPARAKMDEYEETPEGYTIYRPLLDWTARDVFDFHKEHNVKPNPLYSLGMGRVGCMPCINANKPELFEISRRFPEIIDRVEKMERLVTEVSKRHGASFFQSDNGEGIREKVEWSMTTHGGRQVDLMKLMELEDIPTCSSQYGLCE